MPNPLIISSNVESSLLTKTIFLSPSLEKYVLLLYAISFLIDVHLKLFNFFGFLKIKLQIVTLADDVLKVKKIQLSGKK